MKKNWMVVAAAACLLAGCGGKDSPGEGTGYRDDVASRTLVEAVAEELGDEYWPDAEIPPEYLNDWYGVSEEMYEDYYGQTPMISTNVDSLLVVRASEGHVEDVEQALDTYRESMVQDTLQYPMNVPKIQASMIETFGNYVCFVQLGGFMENIEDDNEAAIAACQKVNERALGIIEGRLTE